MNKILLLLLFSFSMKTFANKRNIELEIEVLLDGKNPIAFAHIYVTNLIPKRLRMADVDIIGVKSTDKRGKLIYKIDNLNAKGTLHIKLLSVYCGWYAESYTINLKENKGEKFHVVLNAEPEKCTR